jgi:hypothetical protein
MHYLGPIIYHLKAVSTMPLSHGITPTKPNKQPYCTGCDHGLCVGQTHKIQQRLVPLFGTYELYSTRFHLHLSLLLPKYDGWATYMDTHLYPLVHQSFCWELDLDLHSKVSMLSMFPVHAWSRCGSLFEEHLHISSLGTTLIWTPLDMPKWIYIRPSTNKYRRKKNVPISTPTPHKHQKLTEDEKFCTQNNQTLDKISLVELSNNSVVNPIS